MHRERAPGLLSARHEFRVAPRGALWWADAPIVGRKSPAESRRMAERIATLPTRTIVIAGVKTDGGGQFTAEGVAALRSIGGQQELQRTLWLAHALIGSRARRPARPWRPRDRET